MTEERWVACSVCSKSFVPRFSYQTEAGGSRHFCSVGCRAPELGRSRAAAVTAAAQHNCAVCGKAFEMRFAYQVVAGPSGRRVVCSENCRTQLIESTRPVRAITRPPVRTIAVLNQKGGTGKTTTAVSIAAGLALRGKRTLLVDLDAQGSVSVSLGINAKKTIREILCDGIPASQVSVSARPMLDVIASDHRMAQVEIDLVSAPDRTRVLSRRMAPVVGADSEYDFIVLDCAPSLSLMNQNALVFAREVLVPVSCDYLALVGVKQILRTLRHVNETLNHPVEVAGVLPTFFDVRNKISKQAVEALAGYFKGRVLPPIRVNAKLKEAPAQQKTIFEYAPDSHGATDYLAAVSWLLGGAEREAVYATAAAVSGDALIDFEG